MDLLVYVKSLNDYDCNYHKNANAQLIKDVFARAAVPGDIHLINSILEAGFSQELTIAGKQGLLTNPVKLVLNDLLYDDSALCHMFKIQSGDTDAKLDLFFRIWEKCFTAVMKKFSWSVVDSSTVKYLVYFGDPSIEEIDIVGGNVRGKHFITYIPDDLIKKYYANPECYIPELEGRGYQQFLDFKLFNPDELLEYVVCPYYVELSESYNESLINDGDKMLYLRDFWTDTLITDLG